MPTDYCCWWIHAKILLKNTSKRSHQSLALTVGHMRPLVGQLPGGSPGKLQHGPRGMHPPSRLAIELASLLPALGILTIFIDKIVMSEERAIAFKRRPAVGRTGVSLSASCESKRDCSLHTIRVRLRRSTQVSYTT